MKFRTKIILLGPLVVFAIVGATIFSYRLSLAVAVDKNNAQDETKVGPDDGLRDVHQPRSPKAEWPSGAVADFKKIQVKADREARMREFMENPVEARRVVAKAEAAALKVFLDRHNADVVDPEWGPATSGVLTKGIEILKSKGLTVSFGEPECRNDSCVVNVEWSDARKVDLEIGDVVTHSFAVNCNRSVVLPGERETGAVKAVLTMDCSSWKSGGSVPFVPPSSVGSAP